MSACIHRALVPGVMIAKRHNYPVINRSHRKKYRENGCRLRWFGVDFWDSFSCATQQAFLTYPSAYSKARKQGIVCAIIARFYCRLTVPTEYFLIISFFLLPNHHPSIIDTSCHSCCVLRTGILFLILPRSNRQSSLFPFPPATLTRTVSYNGHLVYCGSAEPNVRDHLFGVSQNARPQYLDRYVLISGE